MKQTTALIVDDEPDLVNLVSLALKQMKIKTIGVNTLHEARSILKSEQIHFCLTDMNLPDGQGLELVKEIQNIEPSIPIAVITAHGNMNLAVESLKAGAFDFVSKPIDISILRSMVLQATELYAKLPDQKSTIDSMLIGESQPMLELKAELLKVSKSQAPIYIFGESGTGKEVAARCIHAASARNQGPFIAVNCGAIPSELIESEFFGHKKGSFSGAIADKIGLFEAAKNGTLFLDEVADLPLNLQVKLLRAIQEKSIRPVGSNQEIHIDCRILSASHKDLNIEILEQRFREDLFYRINVIQLSIPPLSQRKNDAILLANAYLKSHTTLDKKTFQLSDESKLLLEDYAFPGNVRELHNALQRSIALCESGTIEPEHLQLKRNNLRSATIQNRNRLEHDINLNQMNKDTTQTINNSNPELEQNAKQPKVSNDLITAYYDPTHHGALDDFLTQIETGIIQKTLNDFHWNRTAAAKHLGMSFRSLRYKLKKLGLES